jgi:hypothetical protein
LVVLRAGYSFVANINRAIAAKLHRLVPADMEKRCIWCSLGDSAYCHHGSRIQQLSKNTAFAVVVSVTAFTYAHLGGWGPVHLIAVGGGALVFALLYVWRRDLPSNMLAHFLADAAGFLTQ